MTTGGLDDALTATVAALRDASIEAPVLVGGAAIPDEAAALALGADGWSGPDAPTLIATVDECRVKQ